MNNFGTQTLKMSFLRAIVIIRATINYLEFMGHQALYEAFYTGYLPLILMKSLWRSF